MYAIFNLHKRENSFGHAASSDVANMIHILSDLVHISGF